MIFIRVVTSLAVALFFLIGNYCNMVVPIFEKLGIAGLSYFDYWIGVMVLAECIEGLSPLGKIDDEVKEGKDDIDQDFIWSAEAYESSI